MSDSYAKQIFLEEKLILKVMWSLGESVIDLKEKWSECEHAKFVSIPET